MKKVFTTVAFVLVILLLIALPAIILSGCAKVISTEYETVQVEIVEQHHRSGYSVPMRVGKITTMRYVPATYGISVVYDGIEHYISGSETWRAYKDKIGEIVPATLEVRKYDDGIVKYDIIAIGYVEE